MTRLEKLIEKAVKDLLPKTPLLKTITGAWLRANATEIKALEQVSEAEAKKYFDAGVKYCSSFNNSNLSKKAPTDFKTYHKQQQDENK